MDRYAAESAVPVFLGQPAIAVKGPLDVDESAGGV